MTDLNNYGENVAAISAMIHENKDIYQGIYDVLPDDVGGFVGIWSFCATAAQVFSDEEAPYVAGEDFYWIDAIEDYAQKMICSLQTAKLPTIHEMQRWAVGALDASSINRHISVAQPAPS